MATGYNIPGKLSLLGSLSENWKTVCGYNHKYGQCPAFNKTCAKCKKRNHFAKMCHSSPKIMVNEISFQPATIHKITENPRSIIVKDCSNGTLKTRNTSYIKPFGNEIKNKCNSDSRIGYLSEESSHSSPPQLRRSCRETRQPQYLNEYVKY
ncbi:hypothetical protein ACJJTC_011093 [Scirpophaga incertulas]